MPIKEAVAAPRFHHQWLPDAVIFEDGILDKAKDSVLKSKNYILVPLPISIQTSGMSPRSSIGRVDAIYINDKGKVEGGADPRGDDHATILNK